MEAFYINRKTQSPDNYCKECRKASSRARRETEIRLKIVNNQRIYPVITRIHDRTLRLELIRHALQMVRESTERKRKQLHETEYDNFQSTLNYAQN